MVVWRTGSRGVHGIGSQHTLFRLLLQEHQLVHIRVVHLRRDDSRHGDRREVVLPIHRALLRLRRTLRLHHGASAPTLRQADRKRRLQGSGPWSQGHHRHSGAHRHTRRHDRTVRVRNTRTDRLQPNKNITGLLLRRRLPQPARHQPGVQSSHIRARRHAQGEPRTPPHALPRSHYHRAAEPRYHRQVRLAARAPQIHRQLPQHPHHHPHPLTLSPPPQRETSS